MAIQWILYPRGRFGVFTARRAVSGYRTMYWRLTTCRHSVIRGSTSEYKTYKGLSNALQRHFPSWQEVEVRYDNPFLD